MGSVFCVRLTFGVATPDNNPHIFAIGSDGTLYLNWRNAEGAWSGWMRDWNDAPKLQSIFGVSTPDNNPHIFAIGSDGTLYLNWRSAEGAWSGWMRDWNDAPKLQSIFGVSTSDNNPHIFAIGSDGTLYLNWRNAEGAWSGWMRDWNDAPKLQSIFGVSTPDNNPHIFAIGSDGTLYLNWRNAEGAWSGWMRDWNDAPKLQSIFGVSTPDNNPHIFAIGSDGTLYLNWRNAEGAWSGWMRDWNDAPKLQSIFGVSTSDNNPHIFAIGSDGTLYLNWRNAEGAWSGWMRDWNDAPKLQSIFGVSTPDNNPHIFAIGSDGTLYLNWRNAEGAWSGWIGDWNGAPNTVPAFSGGYYDLDIPGLGWAQHTYVLTKSGTTDEVKFPCYGGTDASRRLAGSVYPATLYKPQLLPPYTEYGKQVSGNLRLARGIACGEPNAAPRSDYDRRSGGVYLLGDCCGLIYAFNGVCHHMAARILWACDQTPVVWPPSVTASYWVWFDSLTMTGFYGNNWSISSEVFRRMQSTLGLQSVRTDQGSAEMSKLMRDSARIAVTAVSQPEFQNSLSRSIAMGAAESDASARAIPAEMVRFHQLKAELDRQLMSGTIAREEYVNQLNLRFQVAMQEMKNMLSPEGYKNTFGLSVDAPATSLPLDAALIPENLAVLKLIDS